MVLSLAVAERSFNTRRNLMKTKIYFSYGITKSGSTLAFQMASLCLEKAGFPQPKLPPPAIEEVRRINFVDNLDETTTKHLIKSAEYLGHTIVIKTHSPPNDYIRDLSANGIIKSHACIRDPRDIALSMLDHSKKSRSMGKLTFTEIKNLDDAKSAIQNQFSSFEQWASLPNSICLSYDEIAFDSEETANRIATHMGVSDNYDDLAQEAKERFTQYNKGLQNRHRAEMSPDESADFVKSFPKMLDFLNTSTVNKAHHELSPNGS